MLNFALDQLLTGPYESSSTNFTELAEARVRLISVPVCRRAMSYACANKWTSSPPLSPHRPPRSWSLTRKPSRPHPSTRSRWEASTRGSQLPSTRRFLQLPFSPLSWSTHQRWPWGWRTTTYHHQLERAAGPRSTTLYAARAGTGQRPMAGKVLAVASRQGLRRM